MKMQWLVTSVPNVRERLDQAARFDPRAAANWIAAEC